MFTRGYTAIAKPSLALEDHLRSHRATERRCVKRPSPGIRRANLIGTCRQRSPGDARGFIVAKRFETGRENGIVSTSYKKIWLSSAVRTSIILYLC